MAKIISQLKFDDTISLTECADGFWLYDQTRGMNLSMRAENKDAAFFEALKYYQQRTATVEKELKELSAKVENFVSLFVEDERDEYRS